MKNSSFNSPSVEADGHKIKNVFNENKELRNIYSLAKACVGSRLKDEIPSFHKSLKSYIFKKITTSPAHNSNSDLNVNQEGISTIDEMTSNRLCNPYVLISLEFPTLREHILEVEEDTSKSILATFDEGLFERYISMFLASYLEYIVLFLNFEKEHANSETGINLYNIYLNKIKNYRLKLLPQFPQNAIAEGETVNYASVINKYLGMYYKILLNTLPLNNYLSESIHTQLNLLESTECLLNIGQINKNEEYCNAVISFLTEVAIHDLDINENQIYYLIGSVYMILYTRDGFELPVAGALVLILSSHKIVKSICKMNNAWSLISNVIALILNKLSGTEKSAICLFFMYPVLLLLSDIDNIIDNNAVKINSKVYLESIHTKLKVASEPRPSIHNDKNPSYSDPESYDRSRNATYISSFSYIVFLLKNYLKSFNGPSSHFLSIEFLGHGYVRHLYVFLCVALTLKKDCDYISILKKVSLAACYCTECVELCPDLIGKLILLCINNEISSLEQNPASMKTLISEIIPNSISGRFMDSTSAAKNILNDIVIDKYIDILKSLWTNSRNKKASNNPYINKSLDLLVAIGAVYMNSKKEPNFLMEILASIKDKKSSGFPIHALVKIDDQDEEILFKILDIIMSFKNDHRLLKHKHLIECVSFILNRFEISRACAQKCIYALIHFTDPTNITTIWNGSLSPYFKVNSMKLDKEILSIYIKFYRKLAILLNSRNNSRQMNTDIKESLKLIFRELSISDGLNKDFLSAFNRELISISIYIDIIDTVPGDILNDSIECPDIFDSFGAHRNILAGAVKRSQGNKTPSQGTRLETFGNVKKIEPCSRSIDDDVRRFNEAYNRGSVYKNLTNNPLFDLVSLSEFICDSMTSIEFDKSIPPYDTFVAHINLKLNWWTSPYYMILEYFSVLKYYWIINNSRLICNYRKNKASVSSKSTEEYIATNTIPETLSSGYDFTLVLLSEFLNDENCPVDTLLNLANSIINYSALIASSAKFLHQDIIEQNVTQMFDMLASIIKKDNFNEDPSCQLILSNSAIMCFAFTLESLCGNQECFARKIISIYSAHFEMISSKNVNIERKNAVNCFNYLGLATNLILRNVLNQNYGLSLVTNIFSLISDIYKNIEDCNTEHELHNSEFQGNGVIIGLAVLNCDAAFVNKLNTRVPEEFGGDTLSSLLTNSLIKEVVRTLDVYLEDNKSIKNDIIENIDNMDDNLTYRLSVLALLNLNNLLPESYTLNVRNVFKITYHLKNMNLNCSNSVYLDETLFIASCLKLGFEGGRDIKEYFSVDVLSNKYLNYWRTFSATISLDSSNIVTYVEKVGLDEFYEKINYIQLSTPEDVKIIPWYHYIKCRMLQMKFAVTIDERLKSDSFDPINVFIYEKGQTIMQFLENELKNNPLVNGVIKKIIHTLLYYKDDPIKNSKILHVCLFSLKHMEKRYITQILENLITMVYRRISHYFPEQHSVLVMRSLLYLSLSSWSHRNVHVVKIYLKILSQFMDRLKNEDFAKATCSNFASSKFSDTFGYELPIDCLELHLFYDNSKFILETMSSTEGIIKCVSEISNLLILPLSHNQNYNNQKRKFGRRVAPQQQQLYKKKYKTNLSDKDRNTFLEIMLLMTHMFLHIIRSKNPKYLLNATCLIQSGSKFMNILMRLIFENSSDNEFNILIQNSIHNFTTEIWKEFIAVGLDYLDITSAICVIRGIMSIGFFVRSQNSPSLIGSIFSTPNKEIPHLCRLCISWSLEETVMLSKIGADLLPCARLLLANLEDKVKTVNNSSTCMLAGLLTELYNDKLANIYAHIYYISICTPVTQSAVFTLINVIPALLKLKNGVNVARTVVFRLIPLLISHVHPDSCDLHSNSLNETMLYYNMLIYLPSYLSRYDLDVNALMLTVKCIYKHVKAHSEDASRHFMSYDEAYEFKNTIMRVCSLQKKKRTLIDIYNLVAI